MMLPADNHCHDNAFVLAVFILFNPMQCKHTQICLMRERENCEIELEIACVVNVEF